MNEFGPRLIPFLVYLLLAAAVNAGARQRVNEHSLRLQEFEKRVTDYVKLHKSAGADLTRLRPTDTPESIPNREQELARRIRRLRGHARRGDIFTPRISTEFRRLIGLTLQGQEAVQIRGSLKRAEPVSIRLRVNDTYPANLPLQSTPPSLLQNVPALPKELEYRVVDHDLVLRDTEANLIVDFMPRAIP